MIPLRLFLVFLFWFCSSATAASLNGTWQGELQGQPLSVTLGANGQGVLDDAPIRYQIAGNTLLIDNAGQKNTYQFRQQGDTLIVSGSNLHSPITLTRGKSKVAKAKSAPATKNTGNGSSSVRRELVGKWCKAATLVADGGGDSQSSACFDLKANGSYTYVSQDSMDGHDGGMSGGTNAGFSDTGVWTATENSITAQSGSGQTKRYQLEKKNHPKTRAPMLCVDGDCYVTYRQRARW